MYRRLLFQYWQGRLSGAEQIAARLLSGQDYAKLLPLSFVQEASPFGVNQLRICVLFRRMDASESKLWFRADRLEGDDSKAPLAIKLACSARPARLPADTTLLELGGIDVGRPSFFVF